jgi:hypothetical protein
LPKGLPLLVERPRSVAAFGLDFDNARKDLALKALGEVLPNVEVHSERQITFLKVFSKGCDGVSLIGATEGDEVEVGNVLGTTGDP